MIDKRLHFDWKVFCDVLKEKRLVIFGAGELCYDYCKTYSFLAPIEAIVDNHCFTSNQYINGIRVQHPSVLNDMNLDEIVILLAVSVYHLNELEIQIRELNIEWYFHYELMQRNKMLDLFDTSRINKISLSTSNWYQKDLKYAHAMGLINGVSYTNSLEAFVDNYKKGFRFFEVDVNYSEAGELLLCHGRAAMKYIMRPYNRGYILEPNHFNAYSDEGFPFTVNEFIHEKVYGKYTPLTFVDLLELMYNYKDIFVILDHSGVNPSRFYNQVREEVFNHCASLFDRIIFQISDKEVWDRSGFNKYSKNNIIPVSNMTIEKLMLCMKALKTPYCTVQRNRITSDFTKTVSENGGILGMFPTLDYEDVPTGIDFLCMG